MSSIVSLLPFEVETLIRRSARDVVDAIGMQSIRKIVVGVLCGENARTATEPLTRERRPEGLYVYASIRWSDYGEEDDD